MPTKKKPAQKSSKTIKTLRMKPITKREKANRKDFENRLAEQINKEFGDSFTAIRTSDGMITISPNR